MFTVSCEHGFISKMYKLIYIKKNTFVVKNSSKKDHKAINMSPNIGCKFDIDFASTWAYCLS